MMFDRYSSRERVMIGFLAIIAIIAIYYYFLYQPIIDNRDILEAQKSDSQVEINKQIITLRKMPDLESRYRELEYIENEELSNRISSVDDVLRVLEDESENSGIKITSFVPKEQEKTTIINMVAEGSFEELVLFLRGVKRLEGQIEFADIKLSHKNQENNILIINGIFIYHNDLLFGGDQS